MGRKASVQLPGHFKRLTSDFSHKKKEDGTKKKKKKKKKKTLRKKLNLFSENNAIRTNHTKGRIDRTPENSSCRLRGYREKSQ